MEPDCIQCPFHGLEFDKAGQCTLIPAKGKAFPGDISRYNVRQYPVKEAHGIIYLWYDDEEKLTSVLPFFDEEIDASCVFSEIEDPWNSHYSRCIENQLDVVHLPFVHHNTIGKGNKTLIHCPKVLWEDGILTTSANNEVDVGQKTKSPDECVIKSTYLRFIYPNVWLNHISEKIKVLIYFAPVDEENTILYIRFYCRITKFKPLNRFIAYTGKFANRTIERQDKRVVITQKPRPPRYDPVKNLCPGMAPSSCIAKSGKP
jgi:phenylpropionate dioxygenase-like ring-hydroxylating dioxygenase large terminal subunit